MSLALVAAAAMGAFAIATSHLDRQERKIPKKKGPEVNVAQRQLHTGRYGDISEISHLLAGPNAHRYVQKILVDQDLSGVPCRWIVMPNGAAYKTYDMNSPDLPNVTFNMHEPSAEFDARPPVAQVVTPNYPRSKLTGGPK